MAVSIIEISKVAGVSKSTVSRVLNQHPAVSPTAVEAVRVAAARLGYAAPTNGVGRPRRSGNGGARTGTVALLFPDTDPQAMRTVLSGRLLHGVEEVLRREGLTLVLTALPDVSRLPQCIEQRQVDGVLLRSGYGAPADRVGLAEALGKMPVVHLFEPKESVPPSWDVVLEDNDAIAEAAVRFLTSRRRRRLAFVNQMPEHPSLRHRGRSFAEATERADADALILSADRPADDLVSALIDPSTGLATVDGVFVPGPDNSVVDVYRALAARGVRVGRDVDFVSCNNDVHRLATLDARLANIDIEAEAIGRAAAETLVWRLAHPSEPRRRIAIAPSVSDPPASVV